MRGKRVERWLDALGELAWIGLVLGAAFMCPIASARHLVEIGVAGWLGWRVVRWLPPGLRGPKVVSRAIVKDPVAEINAIVAGLWDDSDTEEMGEE
ncbi:MAG: hypothetical protein U0768_04870 [Anaerolineae bacterium]